VANTKTAKKQMLVNKRNHARNLHFKTRMKNVLKKARAVITNTEIPVDEAEKALKEAQRVISKTKSKGIIHKNTAARKISRLTLLYRAVRVEGYVKPEATRKRAKVERDAEPAKRIEETVVESAPIEIVPDLPAIEDAPIVEMEETTQFHEVPFEEHEPEDHAVQTEDEVAVESVERSEDTNDADSDSVDLSEPTFTGDEPTFAESDEEAPRA
jgi:small subunit ribosomal protein S20